jgi:NAD(P)-dependent dehydrogenase (short-subunit alcohol dehydrogenase family)
MKVRAPNNAGIGQGTVADNDDDEWLRVLNVTLPERALYSASKGAGLAQTGAMAADHLREGIRVNCVNPGTADTAWIGRLPECAEAAVRLDHGDRTGRRRGHAGPAASFGLSNAHNCADRIRWPIPLTL